MCQGPGTVQTPEQKRATSVAMRRYWRSPAGVARRAALREAAKAKRAFDRSAAGTPARVAARAAERAARLERTA